MSQARWFAVTASLFLFLGNQVAASQVADLSHGDEARDYAAHGISLAREGNLAQAEQNLEQAVKMAPQVALYHAQFGSILGLQNKWPAALEAFQKAVELAPDDLNFRREAAAVQWQLGLMPAAEQNLQFVLARQPDDPGSILLMGMVKERTGNYTEAAKLLDSQFASVMAQPDRVVALFHALVESGQSKKVPKILEALTPHATDRQWADAIGRCLQIAAAARDLQTSETLFAMISKNDAAYIPAALHMAKLFYDNSRVTEARNLLLELQENGIVSADLQALLGSCYESESQPTLALAAYQRAIEADPKRIDFYEDLISLLLSLHKTDDALSEARQAVTIDPNDARAWVWQGNVQLRRNAAKDAMESYQHAAALDHSNADAALGIATIYFVTGQNDEALARYQAGIDRFPDDARFYIACAEMLSGSPDSLKLQAQAVDLLRRAVQLAPQSAEAHFLLGQFALQDGRLQESLDELTQSIHFDPDRSKPHFALSGVYRRLGRADAAAKEFAVYQKLKQSEENTTPPGMGLRTP